MDTIRHSEPEQADMRWHIESVVRGGLAGRSFMLGLTNGFAVARKITDWAFGLVRRDRTPKLSPRR